MTIRDYQAEVLDIDTNEARRVLVALYQSNVGGGVGEFTYKVPSPYKLAIVGIRAHLAMLSTLTEPLAIGNLPDFVNFSERAYAKAANCRVKLQNQDTNLYIVGDGNPINLASMLEGVGGGKAWDLSAQPHIVLTGQTLKMDYSLIQTGAGLTDVATEYGLVLDCLLIRKGGDR